MPGSPGEPVAAIAQSSAAPSGPEVSAAAPIRTREATVEDIERIESLTLEDFETDFSKAKIPDHEGPVSDQELYSAAERVVDALREH